MALGLAVEGLALRLLDLLHPAGGRHELVGVLGEGLELRMREENPLQRLGVAHQDALERPGGLAQLLGLFRGGLPGGELLFQRRAPLAFLPQLLLQGGDGLPGELAFANQLLEARVLVKGNLRLGGLNRLCRRLRRVRARVGAGGRTGVYVLDYFFTFHCGSLPVTTPACVGNTKSPPPGGRFPRTTGFAVTRVSRLRAAYFICFSICLHSTVVTPPWKKLIVSCPV